MRSILASLPIDDWQFWVASAIAIAALWVVARLVLPRAWLPRWAGGGKPKSRKVTLTIDGHPPKD